MQTPLDAEIVKLLAEEAGNPEITGAGFPTVLSGPGGEART